MRAGGEVATADIICSAPAQPRLRPVTHPSSLPTFILDPFAPDARGQVAAARAGWNRLGQRPEFEDDRISIGFLLRYRAPVTVTCAALVTDIGPR